MGVAIEGGFEDRIPLPRIVYIQVRISSSYPSEEGDVLILLQPDGSAYVSSGLRVGHVIVALNGLQMQGLSHRQAALLIASSFKEKSSSPMSLLVVEPLIRH